jgi:hypothetical protein
MKRLGRLLATAGLYIACVVGGTLLVLVGSSLIGYLPYSDRPGPGWHGAGVNWQELRFFLSWSLLLLPSVAIIGLALAVFGQVLAALRSPRWFLALVGALIGGYLALIAVVGAGWYIAIAATPVYAAGVFGLLFGILLFPRWSIGKADRAAPRTVNWLASGALTALAIGAIYLRFLAPHYSQELILDFVRIDPGEQPLASSLEHSNLSESEKVLLTEMFPVGVARFGMSASVGGGRGPQARMVVVFTGPLSTRTSLREPKGGGLVYVQSGSTWKRYPEQGPLLSDVVEFWPSASVGKITVKYSAGEPTDFGFFVPGAS